MHGPRQRMQFFRYSPTTIFLWLLFIFAPSPALTHVDLFVSKSEMHRLIKVEGELWYVENGIVNRAAAEYEMEILPEIDELYFSWANRGKVPIPYSIKIKYEPSQMLSNAADQALSIPYNGNIEFDTDNEENFEPKTDAFFIRLPDCKSDQSPSDSRLRIRFVFDWPSSTNQTQLEIRRRKRCPNLAERKSEFLQGVDDDSDGSGDDFSNDDGDNSKLKRSEISSAADFFGSTTNLFYVSMGCLFGLMLITASMIILYFSRADDGATCCGGGSTKIERKNVDDAASSLLALPSRTNNHPNDQLIISTSTPTERERQLRLQRGCGGSLSSTSGVSNQKLNRRSASPSAMSKCNSGNGAASFVSVVNGNSIRQQQQCEPQNLPSSETLPRVLYFNDARQLDVDEIVKRLAVDKEDIELGRVLLEGTFGEVYLGRLKKATERNKSEENEDEEEDDDEDENWMGVVVKIVKEKSSAQQVKRFLSESLRFIDLPPQANICLPVAVGRTDEENDDDDAESKNETAFAPRFAVCFAHDGFGNLKKFLLRCRGADSYSGGVGPPPMVLSTQDLVYAALQIIRGLLHLHKFRLLHRDVAVRNCLVGHDLTIQICDTGLSRDLFPQDYHCLGDNENRPIKWLSLESLERAEFSTASDVWAFGVALWELTTLAQQPYSEVDPFEMQTFLSADQRLSQPYNCPDELYLLMYCCWNLHAEARPTFSQLLAALEHFYAQLTQYI